MKRIIEHRCSFCDGLIQWEYDTDAVHEQGNVMITERSIHDKNCKIAQTGLEIKERLAWKGTNN